MNSSPKFGGAYIAKPRNADKPNLKILNLAFESGSSEISRAVPGCGLAQISHPAPALISQSRATSRTHR
jgi:hypothetical protein